MGKGWVLMCILISFFPTISPMISFWVFFRKNLILRWILVSSWGVIRDWWLSLLLHSRGEEFTVSWMRITGECSSVEDSNLVLKKRLRRVVDLSLTSCSCILFLGSSSPTRCANSNLYYIKYSNIIRVQLEDKWQRL